MTGRQAADGQVRVLLFHAFGESPGAVDDEHSAVSIRFAEQRAADAESDVAVERFGAGVGIRPEHELVSPAQRFDRAFLPVLAAVDDDDRGGMMRHEMFRVRLLGELGGNRVSPLVDRKRRGVEWVR